MTCTVLFLTAKVTGAEYFVLPDNGLHPHTVRLHAWRGIVKSSFLCLSCLNIFFCVVHQAKNACSTSVLHASFDLFFFFFYIRRGFHFCFFNFLPGFLICGILWRFYIFSITFFFLHGFILHASLIIL